MVPKLLALPLSLLLASLVFSGATLPNSGELDENPPVSQLVQLRGRFVGIKATNKRHQSYIFEFRASEQLNGPGQQSTPKDQLVRFELYDGGGGRELLAMLGVTEPRKLDDFVRELPKAPRYDAVFWLSPRQAELIGLPVPVRASSDLLQAQLRARGVIWQKQETVPDGVRFTCVVPNRVNPESSEIYEATARDLHTAVRAVLVQIDQK